MTFIEIGLDVRARNFFLENIGWKRLALEVLKRGDLEDGRYFTLLPAGTSIEKASDFPYGGKVSAKDVSISTGIKNTATMTGVSEIARYLHGKLKYGTPTCLALADAYSAPSDEWIKTSTLPLYFFEKEIYLIASINDVDNEVIERYLNAVEGEPGFVGLLTATFPKVSHCPGSLCLVEGEELSEMARNATVVFISAYDGEGFVIWEPPNTSFIIV